LAHSSTGTATTTLTATAPASGGSTIASAIRTTSGSPRAWATVGSASEANVSIIAMSEVTAVTVSPCLRPRWKLMQARIMAVVDHRWARSRTSRLVRPRGDPASAQPGKPMAAGP
jgi:hypothetical protein